MNLVRARCCDCWAVVGRVTSVGKTYYWNPEADDRANTQSNDGDNRTGSLIAQWHGSTAPTELIDGVSVMGWCPEHGDRIVSPSELRDKIARARKKGRIAEAIAQRP